MHVDIKKHCSLLKMRCNKKSKKIFEMTQHLGAKISLTVVFKTGEAITESLKEVA